MSFPFVPPTGDELGSSFELLARQNGNAEGSDGECTDNGGQNGANCWEKLAKMGLELTKSELEKRMLETELNHQKLLAEHNALQQKVSKMEQEQQNMVERLAMQQKKSEKQHTKLNDLKQKNVADLAQLSTDREGILVKIDELAQQMSDSEMFKQAFPAHFAEMEHFVSVLKDRFGFELLSTIHPDLRAKIAELFVETGKNCWDANARHNDLHIYGPECLMVHFKAESNGEWRSVLAKHSVPNNNQHQLGIFYYEIKIVNVKNCVAFGLATNGMALDQMVGRAPNTYSYLGDGAFLLNDSPLEEKEQFGRDDVVGCGINLATRRIIFTKNGKRLDTTNLFVSVNNDLPLFPCVSLGDSGDLIDANFGPSFKFDLAAV